MKLYDVDINYIKDPYKPNPKSNIMTLKFFQLFKRMKLFLFVIVFMINLPLVSQASNAVKMAKTVTLSEKKISLNQLLWELKKQTDIVFTYNTKDIENVVLSDLNVINMAVNEVLDQCLKNTNLEYKLVEGTIVIKQKAPSKIKENQQTITPITIKGYIQDTEGEPLIGVSVVVKGTDNGTITDIDGNYTLENVLPGQVITVSYVGKETIEMKVSDGKNVINITMEDKGLLKDVVITGYQTISRERAVGSFGIVTSKDIENKTQNNILDRLEGLVPGMNNNGSTDDNGTTQLTIRGVSTMMANRNPLYVVDGLPYEGDISYINPAEVINVSVLKDATANSIYGARASNGVIVITTKKGESGKITTRYSGSIKFTPKADYDYLNLINSSELVDLQIDGFNFKHDGRNSKFAYNPVIDLLYEHEAGTLSDAELQNRLDVYRNLNNRKQIEDEFAEMNVSHQHNLSVSGGNEKNTYLVSVNYTGSFPGQKHGNNWRLGLNLKDNIKFNKWLEGDILFNSNYSRSSSYNGASYGDLVTDYPSYYMLRDENGEPLNFPGGRSLQNTERLLSYGLYDESFSPITNYEKERFSQKKNHHRIQLGLKANIIEGLSASVRFQLETGNSESKNLYDAESYKVRKMVNGAAVVDDKTETVTLNVPKGSQLKRRLSEHFSYTLRGQLDYFKDIDKHSIVAILGAERRLIRDKNNGDYFMGYDNSTLEIGAINMVNLLNLKGTEALYSNFSWDYNDNIYMQHIENRFVSFYANGSYTYDQRYSLNGSIRIDQSDLFGTDPKYQYRPLWSVGAGWYLKHESFMQNVSWINQLNLRLTYGIGGNVAKDAGPYLKYRKAGVDYLTKEPSIYKTSPANKQLRWEKTATTNLGLDFSVLNSRLNLTVDIYNKSTADLLGYKEVNPFSGWNNILINYGDMYNRGFELSLNAIPVKTKNVMWETTLNFGYNKNKLTNMEFSYPSVKAYVRGGVDVAGYPMNSLFSYRYAGLSSDEGITLVYNRDGEKVTNVSGLDEIVYSGTRDPKYSASWNNKLSIKNFDFSFLLIYNGGHVLRDVTAPIMNHAPSVNQHKSILNRWKVPGDELKKGVMPGFQNMTTTDSDLPWISSDRHIKKADYVKLREVSLSYRLPKRALQKIKLESVAFTLQINNLWWRAASGDIDPEAYSLRSGGNAPSLSLRTPTTYTIGTVINF